MRVTLTSDLHGYFPETTGGDLLIVAGDLTSDHSIEAFFEFCHWIDNQDYKKKVVIGRLRVQFLHSASFYSVHLILMR